MLSLQYVYATLYDDSSCIYTCTYSQTDISLEEAVTVMRVTEVEKDKISELSQLLKQRYTIVCIIMFTFCEIINFFSFSVGIV